MTRKNYAALAAAIMMALTGCGKINGGSADSGSSVGSKAETVADSSESEDSGTESEAEEEPEGEKKPAHAVIGENGAKAVTDVLLIPRENIDISRDVSFRDMYGVHVLHSGVVGLVGAPIDVQFDPDKVPGGQLVFVYDPDELKGVRPDALMFLWYDEEESFYRELEGGVLNTENCSMSIAIDKPGVYLLVNMYTWLNVWGAGLEDDGYEAEYDPSNETISDELWRRHEEEGDIPELADEEYIRSCHQEDGSYVFKVGNAVQLASAVYFVNCADPDGAYPVTIELTKDIDLDGYEWAPMGWSSAGINYEFMGEVIGNGHTIKNMSIVSPNDAGFIGRGYFCQVADLNFENAYVFGSKTGVVIGYARNCILVGCSVQGVTEGNEPGAVVGRDQSSNLVNCTADVVAGGVHTGDFLAGNDMAAAKVAAEHEPTETLWLDDQNRPTREAGLEDQYHNIGWQIKRDGVQVLDRNAKNETSLPWQDYPIISYPGHYEVTLTAFVDGYYIPISNTVEYDIE